MTDFQTAFLMLRCPGLALLQAEFDQLQDLGSHGVVQALISATKQKLFSLQSGEEAEG